MTQTPTHDTLFVTAEEIEKVLQSTLTPTYLSVEDESAKHAGHSGSNGLWYGTHFRIRVHSPSFFGKTLVSKHRMVYAALADLIPRGVHAIAIEVDANERAVNAYPTV